MDLYTDPQKPIQVEPGIYPINKPGPDAPVMVTTNFSITDFAVANEMESSGMPAWLLVADAEGMSVLTAWAAGNFDAERIAKTVKNTGIVEKVNHRRVIIPGHVAVLMGDWKRNCRAGRSKSAARSRRPAEVLEDRVGVPFRLRRMRVQAADDDVHHGGLSP